MDVTPLPSTQHKANAKPVISDQPNYFDGKARRYATWTHASKHTHMHTHTHMPLSSYFLSSEKIKSM